VLVTGASSGIGADTVRELSASGYRVFGSVRSQDDRGTVERLGGEAVALDVVDADSVALASREIERALEGEPLAGLVNNAGIAVAGPWEEIPEEDMRRAFEVNLFGAIRLTRAFLPSLRRARGRIVMVSSISARIASPFIGPYASSKSALEAFCDSLRRELIPFGVSVTSIQPGPVKTPIWGKVRAATVGRYLDSVYSRALESFACETARAEGHAIEVSRVSTSISAVLSARRPKTRIVVSRRARLIRLTGLMPDRLLDRIVTSRIHARGDGADEA